MVYHQELFLGLLSRLERVPAKLLVGPSMGDMGYIQQKALTPPLLVTPPRYSGYESITFSFDLSSPCTPLLFLSNTGSHYITPPSNGMTQMLSVTMQHDPQTIFVDIFN